jgi:hypothetical protein
VENDWLVVANHSNNKKALPHYAGGLFYLIW